MACSKKTCSKRTSNRKTSNRRTPNKKPSNKNKKNNKKAQRGAGYSVDVAKAPIGLRAVISGYADNNPPGHQLSQSGGLLNFFGTGNNPPGTNPQEINPQGQGNNEFAPVPGNNTPVQKTQQDQQDTDPQKGGRRNGRNKGKNSKKNNRKTSRKSNRKSSNKLNRKNNRTALNYGCKQPVWAPNCRK